MGLFGNAKRVNSGSQSFRQNHVLYSKGYAVIWIRDECLKSKKSIAEAFRLVCPTVAPSRENYQILLKSAKTLLDTLRRHEEKFYADALKTSDAKRWFDDMYAVESDLNRRREIEKYIYYADTPVGTAQIAQREERYQIELRHLIDRSIASGSSEKQFQVLLNHTNEMDEKTLKKLKTKYKTFF